jgi:hypothetical protein
VKAGHLVLAYHGCDITTRDQLVSGRLAHLDKSENQYDWLGPGVYFFEDDHQRALMFANASHQAPERRYTARPIATPAVVGAILQVQEWLDMTTQDGIQEFAQASVALAEHYAETGKPIPVNSRVDDEDNDILLRRLDNAVFTYIHILRESDESLSEFQAVRAAFHQGREIVPLSGFHISTHVQIALRDPACVKGWFLPPGAQLLSETEYSAAEARLAAARKAYTKPRIKRAGSPNAAR